MEDKHTSVHGLWSSHWAFILAATAAAVSLRRGSRGRDTERAGIGAGRQRDREAEGGVQREELSRVGGHGTAGRRAPPPGPAERERQRQRETKREGGHAYTVCGARADRQSLGRGKERAKQRERATQRKRPPSLWCTVGLSSGDRERHREEETAGICNAEASADGAPSHTHGGAAAHRKKQTDSGTVSLCLSLRRRGG